MDSKRGFVDSSCFVPKLRPQPFAGLWGAAITIISGKTAPPAPVVRVHPTLPFMQSVAVGRSRSLWHPTKKEWFYILRCLPACLLGVGGVMTPRSYAHSLSPRPRRQVAGQPATCSAARVTEHYKPRPELLSKVERAAAAPNGFLSRPSYSSCHPIRSIDRSSKREFSPLILGPSLPEYAGKTHTYMCARYNEGLFSDLTVLRI